MKSEVVLLLPGLTMTWVTASLNIVKNLASFSAASFFVMFCIKTTTLNSQYITETKKQTNMTTST